MNNIGIREKDYYSRRPIPASSDYSIETKKNELELLKQKINIITTVSKYIKIKKPNKNRLEFMGLCPFHTERTPSFGVSPQRDIFHCRGCGAGGDSFDFIQKIELVDFKGAVKILKKMYNFNTKKRFGKVYKKKYFDIIGYEDEFGNKHEELVFLEDEISQRVMNIIYQEREEKYSKIYGKQLQEIINNHSN